MAITAKTSQETFSDGTLAALLAEKICTRCGELRPIADYNRHATQPWSDRLHPHCRLCRNRYERERRLRDPAVRERHRRAAACSRFGITKEHYADLMLISACQICGITREENDRPLCFDHDHATGSIRGVLCTQCNLAIGYLRDDPRLIRQALAYLEG